MLKTISIGSCVSVQGLLVGQAADSMIKVKVDDKIYVGRPIESNRKN